MLLTKDPLSVVIGSVRYGHMRNMAGHGHHLRMVSLGLNPTITQSQHRQDCRQEVGG